MTAAEHDFEAERHRAAARQAEAAVAVAETTMPPQSGSEVARSSGYASGELAGGRASEEIAKAERHENAARTIRDRAVALCRRVPAAEQRVCPLPSVGRVEPIVHGLRLVPAASIPAELMRITLECATARADVERPVDPCPLYAPGTSARVVDRRTGAVIDFTVDSDGKLAELKRRMNAHLQGAH